MGEVKTVKLTAAERKKQREMARNLQEFKRRDAVRREADEARAVAETKARAAETMDEQVRVMAEKLGTTGKSMSFEARAKARRNLLAQKEIADKVQAEADAATEAFHALKKKMQSQNPDEDNWLDALDSVNLSTQFMNSVGSLTGSVNRVIHWVNLRKELRRGSLVPPFMAQASLLAQYRQILNKASTYF